MNFIPTGWIRVYQDDNTAFVHESGSADIWQDELSDEWFFQTGDDTIAAVFDTYQEAFIAAHIANVH